jgi:PAS domain-containing protein
MGTESEINFFFSMSPDMCCLVSNDGEILKVNQVWEHKMGYPMDYFVEKIYTVHDPRRCPLGDGAFSKENPWRP